MQYGTCRDEKYIGAGGYSAVMRSATYSLSGALSAFQMQKPR